LEELLGVAFAFTGFGAGEGTDAALAAGDGSACTFVAGDGFAFAALVALGAEDGAAFAGFLEELLGVAFALTGFGAGEGVCTFVAGDDLALAALVAFGAEDGAAFSVLVAFGAGDDLVDTALGAGDNLVDTNFTPCF